MKNAHGDFLKPLSGYIPRPTNFPVASMKHAGWALVENKKDDHSSAPHSNTVKGSRWPVHRSSDFVCCLFPLRPPVHGRKACPGRTPIYKHIQMASSSYVKLDTFRCLPPLTITTDQVINTLNSVAVRSAKPNRSQSHSKSLVRIFTIPLS
jgi:hypothetical protein